MEDGDDDRLITLIGAGVAVLVVFAAGTAVLAASNLAGSDAEAAPDASFEVTRINGSHVRIEHTGGESLAASDLTVIVGRYERQVEWGERIGPGDRVVVPAQRGAVVRLYYDGGRGDRVLIERWQP